ncbi:hypothetical protein CASFOL_008337 [Castilleja foliolosa]|uniref:Cytochrome P450 n=1 Tax=Castilleja foliolosa TaxID=1961234 RepID=A0ABD3DZP9_9LAMI
MMTIVYLLLLLLLPIFIFFLKQYVGFRKLPPGPTAFQLFQNISSLSTKPHVALKDLAKTYGPLMSFRLGGQLIIVASSQSTATEIFKTHNRIFSARQVPSIYYDVPGAMHASLVMASDCNDTWRFLHGLGQNYIFSSKAIELATEIRRARVAEMMRWLIMRTDEVVNIEEVVLAIFTNIISNILTSNDLFDVGGESESDVEVKMFLRGVIEKVTRVGLADVFPVLRRVDFWNRGRAMEMYREILLIWDGVIKD